MESNIRVSIVCNAYNHEKYIKDALDGFVMQRTSFAYEILIHDDASTDQTAEIIREYEKKYPELIKPIYQTENQYSQHNGVIKRLQSERVKGKYVATCEGDDYWTDPCKLQKQYDFMEAHPEYTLCGCSTKVVNVLSGKLQNRCTTDEDRDVTFEEFLMPRNGRPFPLASFFMRAEIWKTRPSWGFPVGDLPLTYYAAMQGKVRMLADEMCVYRWFSNGSWTVRSYNDDTRENYEKRFIEALERMNRETDYRFDEPIKRDIIRKKYALNVYSHSFRDIKNDEEQYSLFKSKPFIYRVKDYIHCTSPGLYKTIMKVVSNNR